MNKCKELKDLLLDVMLEVVKDPERMSSAWAGRMQEMIKEHEKEASEPVPGSKIEELKQTLGGSLPFPEKFINKTAKEN